jgi:hypothetical protein
MLSFLRSLLGQVAILLLNGEVDSSTKELLQSEKA